MTLLVDLKTDTVKIEGDVDALGELSMDRDSYIVMFKSQVFIENNISNPKE